MAGKDVIELFLADETATQRLGERLAASLPDRATVFLYGDLGAGKSTFARAMLRALGVTGPIKSPTYTLIERYPSEQGGFRPSRSVSNWRPRGTCLPRSGRTSRHSAAVRADRRVAGARAGWLAGV